MKFFKISKLGLFLYQKEGRIGKSLLLLSLSLACGIAALVALETFSRRIENTVNRDSRKVLAADFQIRAWRPFDETVWAALEEEKNKGHLVLLNDVVSTLLFKGIQGEEAATVSLRAVEGEAYPFYGDFLTKPSLQLRDLSSTIPEIIVDQSFEARGIKLGDTVQLGEEKFLVRAFLLEEPSAAMGAFAIGARVIILKKWLDQTGLLALGSRVFQQLLVKSPLNSVDFTNKFRAKAPDLHWRITTPERANRQVERVIDRMRAFLSFVGVASLFLGTVGLFMVFRSQLLQKLPSYLTLRCLGAKNSSIVEIALLTASQVALLGSLSGIFMGLGLERFLTWIARQRFTAELSEVSWGPSFFWGFFLSFLCVAISVFLPLREVLKVPVSQAIRQEASEGSRLSRKDALIAFCFATFIVFLVGPQWKMSLTILGGLLIAAILLFVCGALLLKFIPQLDKAFSFRHALLQLQRKKARTQLLIITFGMSLFFLFLILFLGNSIRAQINQINRADIANVFAINISPESQAGLREIIPNAEFVPTTQARVVEMKGKEILEGVVPQDGEERFYQTREYVVTKRKQLSAGEELVEGKSLFGPSREGLLQVSLEERFAKQMDLKVGEEFKIDLAGVRLKTVISSTRKVNWFNFQPNFFMIFHPDEIASAPMNYVAIARVDKEKIPEYQSLVARKLPQVTLVNGDALASRVLDIIKQLSMAIYAVTLFSLLSCCFVFLGIFLARRVELLKELALWRCLGLRSQKILSIYTYEALFLGLLSSVSSALSATVVVAILCRWVMDIPVQFVAPFWLLLLVLIPALLCAIGSALMLRKNFNATAQSLFRLAEETV